MEEEDLATLVCHASLRDSTGSEERTLIDTRGSKVAARDVETRRNVLLGSLVATPRPFTDADGIRKQIFCFPNLYMALPGDYRIKFQLVDVRYCMKRPDNR